MLFLIKLSLKDIKHCSLTWHTKYSEHNLTINIKYCSTIHNQTYKNLMMYTAVCPLYFSKPILHIMVSVLSFFLTLLFFFFFAHYCTESWCFIVVLISNLRWKNPHFYSFFVFPFSFSPHFLLYSFCVSADNDKAWVF